MTRRAIPRGSATALLLLIVYLVALLWLTMERANFIVPDRLHLVPFTTIREQLSRGWPMIINVPGKLVAFVELGLLVPLWQPTFASFRRIFLLGLLISVAIEVIQWTFTTRVADIDDVLLNVLGALLGYLIFAVWLFAQNLNGTRRQNA